MESMRAENLVIAYEKTAIIQTLNMQITQGKIDEPTTYLE